MKDKPRYLRFPIVLLGLLLSNTAICGEKDLDFLVAQLGKTERVRLGLGRFQVMDSEVTRDVISKDPQIIPSLLALTERSEDLRQLASAVYCLREMGCWAAYDTVKALNGRIDKLGDPSGTHNGAAKPDPLGFQDLDMSILSCQIRMFLKGAEAAQQHEAPKP